MRRQRYWTPVYELASMQRALDRLYDQPWEPQDERVYQLPVDVYSTTNDLIIEASVPGINPDSVEITLEGETLTIKGERLAVLENVDYIIQERRHGPFARTLALNVPVQADEAAAVFEQGVLRLTIPKAKEVRPKVIKVTSK
jgi:HSP20 family protein